MILILVIFWLVFLTILLPLRVTGIYETREIVEEREEEDDEFVLFDPFANMPDLEDPEL